MMTIILESKFEQQILSNPKSKDILRNLDLMIKYDTTIPTKLFIEIGSKPTPEHVLQVWIKYISEAIKNAFYNNYNEGLKYLPYLFKYYNNGAINYEDLTGEVVDNIRKWWLIKNTRQLNPKHQDLNSLTPSLLQKILNNDTYRNILRKLENAEVLEKAKRNSKEFVLLDNEKYHVAIPMNYGACYVFNNAAGIQANFCTGGSSGMTWFDRYAPKGPLIMVTDKKNINDADGKWQIHANTKQILNAEQDRRWDHVGNSQKFAKLFPGLMTEIQNAMLEKKDDIKAYSKAILNNAYDVDTEAENLTKTFPAAFATSDQSSNQPELQ